MELEKTQAEERERVRQHDINLRRLDQTLPKPVQNDGFRMSGAIRFVLSFDDVDMSQFLDVFEKAITIHDIPRDKWTQLIHTKLSRLKFLL